MLLITDMGHIRLIGTVRDRDVFASAASIGAKLQETDMICGNLTASDTL